MELSLRDGRHTDICEMVHIHGIISVSLRDGRVEDNGGEPRR